MQNPRSLRTQVVDNARFLVLLACVVAVPQIIGCTLCAINFPPNKSVRGTVIDAETLDALVDVAVSGATVTNGETTGSGGARVGVPVEIEPDGSFELTIFSPDSGSVCGSILDSSIIVSDTTPDFPSPDEILVIVGRDACEQRIVIEMTEETVVDLTFPDGMIELIDPILVPPCQESTETGSDEAP